MSQKLEGPCRSAGWREAVLSVTDLAACEALYREVAGWEVIHRGPAAPEQSRVWRVPGDVPIDEVVLGNPGETRYLRLVKFHGVEQQQIRSSGRFWDVGGISNISCRVLSMAESFGALQRRGWVGHHDPVEFQFGPFTVSEVAATGHDGVVFSLVERLAPKLEPGQISGHFTSPFNSVQIVTDFEAAHNFYLETLGFREVMKTEITWKAPGGSVYGLPFNIAMEHPVKLSIVQPQGVMMGSVELIGPGELISRDFSGRAQPPNLGILMVRYPVEGLDEYARWIEDKGVTLHVPVTELVIEPYGRVRCFAFRSPNGSWLEFYEEQS
jgi:catechol 2,3-dioxygenase-like lactoylglutathione lyase family enzyme